MNKVLALEKLHQEMLADKKLPLKTNLVFGEGNPDARLLFIGEAPGAREDEQKRPFVGRSGQLVRKCIREAGWQEKDVYITNIVKRRPPENRDPSLIEIKKYKPYLARQIEIINPKIIVTLGRFSLNYFLPDAKITRDQGKIWKVGLPAQAGDLNIFPIIHPAFALRGNKAMKMFTESFKKLPSILRDTSKTDRF